MAISDISSELSHWARCFHVLCRGFKFNPVALRKAKIVYNFGLSECNRVEALTSMNSQFYILQDFIQS